MDIKKLTNLVKEYQRCSPESDEEKQVKIKLIEELSSFYWWKASYINNLFPEVIRQIKENLHQDLEVQFQFCINQKHDHEKIAELLFNQAIIIQEKYQKKLITDQFINTLAIQVKKTQPNSFQRKKAEQILIKAMDAKNTYKRKGLREKFVDLSFEDYQDAFKEAKGESVRYALNKIDTYEEERGNFMALINRWIEQKFGDAAGRILGIKKSQSNKREEDKIIIFPDDPNSMSNELDQKQYNEFDGYQRSEEIRKLIEEDPNNKLSKPVRKDRTDIKFKDVLIAISWEGESFKSLEEKWHIPKSTIRNFYKKEFLKVKDDLADYLQ